MLYISKWWDFQFKISKRNNIYIKTVKARASAWADKFMFIEKKN